MRAAHSRLGRSWSLAILGVLLAACTGATSVSTATNEPGAWTDLLANIAERGTILMATDPAYPPASYAVKGATRKPDTRCADEAMTAPRRSGADGSGRST